MNLDRIDAKIVELENQKASLILDVNILEGGIFALRQMRDQIAAQNAPPVEPPVEEPSVIVTP